MEDFLAILKIEFLHNFYQMKYDFDFKYHETNFQKLTVYLDFKLMEICFYKTSFDSTYLYLHTIYIIYHI